MVSVNALPPSLLAPVYNYISRTKNITLQDAQAFFDSLPNEVKDLIISFFCYSVQCRQWGTGKSKCPFLRPRKDKLTVHPIELGDSVPPPPSGFSLDDSDICRALMDSINPADPFSYVTSISVNELPLYGTMCGDVGNKPFRPDVIKLLKDNAVHWIIAAVIIDPSTCRRDIAYFFIPLDANNQRALAVARKLERLVCKYGGALRLDDGGRWISFESE